MLKPGCTCAPRERQPVYELVEILRFSSAAIFLIAAGFVLRDYIKYRGKNRAYQSIAVGILAVLGLVARVDESTHFQYRILFETRLTAYFLAAYALLLFAHTFVPIKRRTRILAGVAILATLMIALESNLPAEAQLHYTTQQMIAILLIVLVTGTFILEPSVRFWTSSRGKPLVQRRRLQAMSLGYSGIIVSLILFAASEPLSRRPVQALLVYGFSVILALILYASLATPAWLRRWWRQNDEISFSKSIARLVAHSPDRTTMASGIVKSAMDLIGASRGAIWEHGGTILSSEGLDQDEINELETIARNQDGIVDFQNTYAVITRLRVEDTPHSMALIAGRFTPIFGSEEVQVLRDYSSAASIALDRVGLIGALQQQTRRYEGLLQTISDVGTGFLITEGARVLYANDAYQKLTGYSFEELRQLPSIIDLTAPDEREKIVDRYTRRMRGDAVEENYETAMIAKDGRRIDLAVGLKLVEEGNRRLIMSVVTDITDRARAMRSLEAAYGREKEAVRGLLELDEMKSDFLSTVSHELRTPLTTIAGFADTLIARWESLAEMQKVNFTQRIATQAGELRNLIEDLLDFTRLERGHFDMESQEFDLRPEILDTLGTLSSFLRKHFVEADVPEVRILADPGGLRRVLGNLLINAAKFSDQGSTIKIRVAPFGQQKMVVSVFDQGIGVRDEEKARIFERFYRVQRGDSAGYGTGIGLAIVKEYAEAMGGRVWVEDSDGGGSIFSFTLQTSRGATDEETSVQTRFSPSSDPVGSSSQE